MTGKRITTVVLFFLVFGLLGYFVLTSGKSILNVFRGGSNTVSYLEIEENAKRVNDMLIKVPHISLAQRLKGFWYVYTDQFGTEHVLYFDPELLKKQGLSDTELKDLYNKLIKSKIERKNAIQNVAEKDLPKNLQFHNTLYSFGKKETTVLLKDKLKAKIQSGKYTQEDLFELGYLYELEGQYAKRDELYKKSCNEFGKRCVSQKTNITVHGRVVNIDGQPLSDVEISVLSNGSTENVYTNTEGEYIIKTKVFSLEKVRLHAVLDNYSDAFSDFLVVNNKNKQYAPDTMVMAKAALVADVDTRNNSARLRTSTSLQKIYFTNNVFTLEMQKSRYEISFDAIIHKNGKPYQGKLAVYVYEFTPETAPASFLRIDVFDQGAGFLSDGMISYGMPYIQFVSESGEELYIGSKKPMLLTHRMEFLTPEYQKKADRPLTKTDMNLLLHASENDGYPLTYTLLQDLGMVYIPPFWVLDRVSGVWNNVGFKLLDINGNIEVPFYTIKNY